MKERRFTRKTVPTRPTDREDTFQTDGLEEINLTEEPDMGYGPEEYGPENYGPQEYGSGGYYGPQEYGSGGYYGPQDDPGDGYGDEYYYDQEEPYEEGPDRRYW